MALRLKKVDTKKHNEWVIIYGVVYCFFFSVHKGCFSSKFISIGGERWVKRENPDKKVNFARHDDSG